MTVTGYIFKPQNLGNNKYLVDPGFIVCQSWCFLWMFYLWSCVTCLLSSAWIRVQRNGFKLWVKTYELTWLGLSPIRHIFQQNATEQNVFHLQPLHMTPSMCNMHQYIFHWVPVDERHSLMSTRQKASFVRALLWIIVDFLSARFPRRWMLSLPLVSPPFRVKLYTGPTYRTGAQS